MHTTPVIMGTYNEREDIPPLVEEILSLGLGLDILIVNDNSPDGTGRIADDLASRHPEVSVLHRPGKLGLGTAYVAGFQHALARGYARVITMDADYSHHTRDLPEFLGKFETHDVVVGTRYITGGGVENWPPYLLALSRGGSLYTRLITGMPLHDATCGFNGFCVEVIRAIRPERIRSEGYSFEIETKFRSWEKGVRIAEIPIVFADRTRGKSKMSKRVFLEAVLWYGSSGSLPSDPFGHPALCPAARPRRSRSSVGPLTGARSRPRAWRSPPLNAFSRDTPRPRR
ncbi:MAG: polyprenol monophosphomannose synthase [Chlamydiae bacterium]|nr:polyprenol monophosphomannose synthase [Chlamydiota bacterium]